MFSQITMAVPDHASIAKFYRQTLGMTDQRDGLGYGAQQAHMNFLQQSKPADKADGFFWKIGITVANLDAAADYLRQSGVSISAPRQFADIGYMAHCTDPAGATIELLQQYPMGGERDIGDSHSVASDAILAHLTLRVRDLVSAQRWCADQGLVLLSVEALESYGFSLYFYAYQQEAPPQDSVVGANHRAWLWQRPYTLLELQHLHGPGPRPAASQRLIALSARFGTDAPALGLSEASQSLSLPLAGLNL